LLLLPGFNLTYEPFSTGAGKKNASHREAFSKYQIFNRYMYQSTIYVFFRQKQSASFFL
jgi:hypothetical protein